MKSIFFHVLLVCGMTATINAAIGQPVPEPTDKYLSFLDQFRQDYVNSILKNNPTLLQRYYADTLRMMAPFQKTMIGKLAVTAYHEAFITRFTLHDFSRHEIEVLDLGSQLMEIGTLTLRVTLKSTGKEYPLRGKYLNLWQKRGEGDPLLLTEIWNYDQYYGEIHDQLKFEDIPSIHEAMLPNVPVTNSIRFELAAYNRLLDTTVTQHDASTWSLYYSDDAMLLASYYPLCKGKNAINAYIDTHVKELPVFEELDIRNDRVDELGMFVIEYASHVASWKNGFSSGVSLGKNIRIWRRESDHSLKLFRSIGNYD